MKNAFHNYPAIYLPLAPMTDPWEICVFLHTRNIRQYTYFFATNLGILKYGQSANDNSVYCGNRIYRQAGNILGWPKGLIGNSGDDMTGISQDYAEMYRKTLHRMDVVVGVIDMSGHTDKDCEELERNLIDLHIQQRSHAPIGNKDTQTLLNERRYHNQRQLEKIGVYTLDNHA
jgi:hypothetical protein